VRKSEVNGALLDIQRKNVRPSFLIGFDGFTDEIVTCVDTRLNEHHYQTITTIEQFAKRIAQAAGKSTNVELISTQTRIGGNGPLHAQALIETNNSVTLIGALGHPSHEELFLPLISRCTKVISIAPSGHTDALEFSDGKILFGKLQNVLHIDVELLLSRISQEELVKLFQETDIFACVNWTMISGMSKIWKYLSTTIFPKLTPKIRWMFVDLADPAKRKREDLQDAILTLITIQKKLSVCLGLNEAESLSVETALQIETAHEEQLDLKEKIIRRAEKIQKKIGISCVVIHATECCAAATPEEVVAIDGPYCRKPYITTGGGDNFNAGFLLGIAYGLSCTASLLIASATSGFYVRMGKSPTLGELIDFFHVWQTSPQALDTSKWHK
jgi:hypothetical protein